MRKSKSKKNENGTSFTEEDDEPLANVASSSEDYEVESIIDTRKKGGKTEFKVRWKGYSEEDDTWEVEDDLHCQELIDAFLSGGKKATGGKKRGRPKGKKPKAGKKAKAVKNEDQEQDEDEEENEDDDDDEKEYEVEKILEVQYKRNGDRKFLVRWKGYSTKEDTWEPESNLNCSELIETFLKKVDKAKSATPRETRVNRKVTQHYRVSPPKTGRTHKRRNQGPRKTYTEETD